MSASDYEFLDCGNGRRLERLGGVVVSRPAPGAAGRRGLPDAAWNRADISFDREKGWKGAAPGDWRVELDGVCLGLRPAAGGQIGVFPEHAQVAAKALAEMEKLFAAGERIDALNLFAHTGLATLRLASREGVAVTHVDAAGAAVRMAKENAALSGLADRPVRWLVDDVLEFCRKDERRGRRYGVIVADPPAFGRGGKGREWKLERDFPELLGLLGKLLGKPGLLCLTCHREGWTAGTAARSVRGAFGGRMKIDARELTLGSGGKGETLRAGVAVYGVIERF